MISRPISGKDFWKEIRKESSSSSDSFTHYHDEGLQYVAMFGLKMVPIIRTAEELFSDTVAREQKAQNLIVAINGNMWDATTIGIADALSGEDPVPASETLVEGLVIHNGKKKVGSSEPERFFLSYRGEAAVPYSFTSTYSIGFGDPPLEKCAIGGLGPLIINKLPYGSKNVYRPGVPPGAPLIGDPGSVYSPYLLQRSSAHFAKVAAFSKRSGKVIFALNRESDVLLVLVQPNDSKAGMSWDQVRDKLVSVATDDAVFLDGSDSALLVLKGFFVIQQDEIKNELTTVGLGFRK